MLSVLLLLSYLLLVAVYIVLEFCNDLLKLNKNVMSLIEEWYVPKVEEKAEE